MKLKNSLKAALVGYGRMGKAIHEFLHTRGYPAPMIIDPAFPDITMALEDAATADVCIELSHPAAVVNNLLTLADVGVPVVCGTTGWTQEEKRVKDYFLLKHGSLLLASNFSLAVYIVNRLVELAASLIAAFPEYDIAIHESHHRGKVDAPSGTALALARSVMENCPRKEHLLTELPERKIEDSELLVSANRIGRIVGVHELIIDSHIDTIRLLHEAKNRDGFVEGAITAAHWIADKKGVFNIQEMYDVIVAK